VAASSIVYLHMEDAANVIGDEELSQLINRTREFTLADPPQFLTELLTKLKESACGEDGELDVQALSLLVDNEIGSIAAEELKGARQDDCMRMIFEILRVV